MLKIRQAQVDAFADLRWEAFFHRTSQHVRANFPDATGGMSETDLRLVFDSVVRRCQAFGLHSERQIICMMDSTMLLGDRFEEQPKYRWARDVLTSERMSADDRAKRVLAAAVRVGQRGAMVYAWT